MDRFYTKTEKTIIIVCCCIVAIMLLNSMASLVFSGKASFYIIGITVFVVLFGFICGKTKIYMDNRFWIALFILGLIAKVFVAIFVHADVISDMRHCLNAAQSTLQGDMSWQEEKYFFRYGFQIPFVLYEALILRLFGSVIMLYVMNAFLSILTAILINRIIFIMLNDAYCSWVISTIYMILPSTFLRISVLYNQILGGFFLTLGLFFYFSYYCKSKKTLFFVTASFFFGLGSIFRQDVIIAFIAIICVEAFLRCRTILNNRRNFKTNKREVITALSLPLFILGFFCTVKGIDYVLRITQLAKYGIGNNAPLNTLIQGWTPESNGSYSIKYSFLNNETENMTFLQGVKYVISYISSKENMNIIDWVYFLLRKTYTMWGSVEGAYTLLETHSIVEIIALCIACMEVPFYCGILGCALYGIKKEYDYKTMFLSVCIIGYFIAYIIVEVQPRYRYDPLICIFLLASFGVLKFKKKHIINSVATRKIP